MMGARGRQACRTDVYGQNGEERSACRGRQSGGHLMPAALSPSAHSCPRPPGLAHERGCSHLELEHRVEDTEQTPATSSSPGRGR